MVRLAGFIFLAIPFFAFAQNCESVIVKVAIYPTSPVSSRSQVISMPFPKGELLGDKYVTMAREVPYSNLGLNHRFELNEKRSIDYQFLPIPERNSEGEYAFHPNTKEFQNVNVFYQIRKGVLFFSDLGFDLKKPLLVITNLDRDHYYDSEVLVRDQVVLYFANGPPFSKRRSSSRKLHEVTKDGTTIAHETSHGFLHSYYARMHLMPNWMNEGLADYFSARITGGKVVNEYTHKDMRPVKDLGPPRDLSKTPRRVLWMHHIGHVLAHELLKLSQASLVNPSKLDRAIIMSLDISGMRDIRKIKAFSKFLERMEKELPELIPLRSHFPKTLAEEERFGNYGRDPFPWAF